MNITQIGNNKIYINGELIKLPKKVIRSSQTVIQEKDNKGDVIYINGYRYNTITKEFKFSIIGFLKTIFF